MPGVMSKFIEASMKASGAQQDIFDRVQQVEDIKQKRIDRERQKIGGELEYYHGILSNADMRLQMDDDTLARLKGKAMSLAQSIGLDWADPDPIPGDMQKFIYDLQTNPKMQNVSPYARYLQVKQRYGQHFERSRANFINADAIKRSMEPKPEVKPGKAAATPAPAFQSMPDTSQPEAQPAGEAPHRDSQPTVAPSMEEMEAEQMFGQFYDPYTPEVKAARAETKSYDQMFMSPSFIGTAQTNRALADQLVIARNARAAEGGLPLIDPEKLPAYQAVATLQKQIMDSLGRRYQELVKQGAAGNGTPEGMQSATDALNIEGSSQLGEAFTPYTVPPVKLSPMAKAKLQKAEAETTRINADIENAVKKIEQEGQRIAISKGTQALNKWKAEKDVYIRMELVKLGREKLAKEVQTENRIAGSGGKMTTNTYMTIKAKYTQKKADAEAIFDVQVDPNDATKTIDNTKMKQRQIDIYTGALDELDSMRMKQQGGGGQPTAGTAGGTTVSPALRKLATMGERLRPGKNKQDLSDLLNNPKFRNNQVLIGEAINKLRDAFNKGDYD